MIKFRLIISSLCLSIFMGSCATVPITGRRQISIIPQHTILEYSESNYRKFLSDNEVITSGTFSRSVYNVGTHIAASVQEYFNEKWQISLLDGYEWEFNLVDKKDVNAWCMPGGKVVVYSGIREITKHEGGLAVVMAHEIAHAIANHGNE